MSLPRWEDESRACPARRSGRASRRPPRFRCRDAPASAAHRQSKARRLPSLVQRRLGRAGCLATLQARNQVLEADDARRTGDLRGRCVACGRRSPGDVLWRPLEWQLERSGELIDNGAKTLPACRLHVDGEGLSAELDGVGGAVPPASPSADTPEPSPKSEVSPPARSHCGQMACSRNCRSVDHHSSRCMRVRARPPRRSRPIPDCR